MANINPKASIIIPTYNSAKTITRCLTSILNQDYDNLEIIVVDDGSTDETVKLVSKFPPIKLILNRKNKGPSHARNIGITNSTGEIIILLDSDSYVENKAWVRQHIEAHSRHDKCLIGGGIQGVGRGFWGKAESYFWITNIPQAGQERPFAIAHLVTNNLSFRRNIFDAVGGFDESIRSGEDIIFCQEAERLGFKLIMVSNMLIYHQDRAGIIRRWFRYGQDRPILKKKGVYKKYSFLLPSNPFLCFLVSPLVALLLTIRIIIGWWHWDKRVILYSPAIFINYFFMALGAASGAWRFFLNKE